MEAAPRYVELQRLLTRFVPGSSLRGLVYLVGGCVRDELLGRPYNDMDAVVEQTDGAEKLARAIFDAFPGRVSTPRRLGAGYPIWQVVFKEVVEWDGSTFEVAGCELEIADTQKEMFPDPASRARVAVFGSLAEDCARRDFTANMLYFDVTREEIVDPSGVGLADLRAGRLRGHPKVDLSKIFSDDPLRIVRLFRFQARFSWQVDPGCWEALGKTRDRLEILSRERVRDEFLKMMVDGNWESALEEMRRQGVLNLLLPEFLPMLGCTQDKIYHSEGDVWVHTLLVIRNAPKTPLQQLTALLHDLGKPPTRSEVGDRVKFLGHEKISTQMARGFLEKWKFPPVLGEQVLRLIDLHLRGGDVSRWKSTKPARKLLRDAGPLVDELLSFIEADSRSSLGPDGEPRLEHLALLREKFAQAREIPLRATPLFKGGEIMELLAMPAGPRIKEVQNFVQDLEDQWAEENKILGVDEAKRAILEKFSPSC